VWDTSDSAASNIWGPPSDFAKTLLGAR
jgi:hypothetical protein